MPIQLLGVNVMGAEPGNAEVTAHTDLPWLQDTVEDRVWEAWGAADREVFVLDRDNRLVAVFDLTVQDLSLAQNRDELRNLLLETASAQGR